MCPVGHLEIDVRADTGLDCTNPAGFVVLAPRQTLNAAPNALFALNADRLDGLDSSAFRQPVRLRGLCHQKINRDARYTLTAIGAPMPMLHVAKEIDEAALTAGPEARPGDDCHLHHNAPMPGHAAERRTGHSCAMSSRGGLSDCTPWKLR
ncbi:MAG: hypothetical protein HY718_04960 [Planctomycetes bacterium]|nr:hypothetical protein [Planctomycetota bacterium]